MEVLGTAIRQEKEINGIQIGEHEGKLSLFADNMIVYVKNPIDSTRKIVDLRSKFGKTAGPKVNIQISNAFLYINNEILVTEIRNKIPFPITTTKLKYLGGKRPVLRKLHNTEERN